MIIFLNHNRASALLWFNGTLIRYFRLTVYLQSVKIMKTLLILVLELGLTALIVFAGVSGKGIPFINSPRAAAIILGVMGFFFCMISVGKFIEGAPAHPLTIAGYVLGAVAMLVIITQVFQWRLPVLGNPKTALYLIAICIAIKAVIGRFASLIT